MEQTMMLYHVMQPDHIFTSASDSVEMVTCIFYVLEFVHSLEKYQHFAISLTALGSLLPLVIIISINIFIEG